MSQIKYALRCDTVCHDKMQAKWCVAHGPPMLFDPTLRQMSNLRCFNRATQCLTSLLRACHESTQ